MKKFPIVLSLVVLSLFVFVNSSYAKNAEDNSSGSEVKEQEREQEREYEEEDEKEEVRNQVEETREIKKEMRDDLDDDNASGSARSRINAVSDRVSNLMEMKEDKSGIGQKVKEVAKEQIKSQEKVAEKLAKMEEKKIWFKKMFGYDEEAVLGVKEEIDANRLRIQELTKLQEETTDKTEMAEIESAINSLIEQNASLEEIVQEEMKNQGVWGWFRSMFKKN